MIIIDKWTGLATNSSPYAQPPTAAATQVNVQALIPGELACRKGMTGVSFTTHTGSTSPIINCVNFQHGTITNIVYQNAAGGIYVAKGPS